MKWDKALNYLLAIFITVNVILALVNYQKDRNAYRLDDERIETMHIVLEQNNIVIDTDVPRSFKPMNTIEMLPLEVASDVRNQLVRELIGVDATITKEQGQLPYEQSVRVYSKGNKQLRFTTNYIEYIDHGIDIQSEATLGKKEALDIAEEFVADLAGFATGSKLQAVYQEKPYGAEVIYYEVYENRPIYTSYIQVKITPDGIYEAIIHANQIKGVSDRILPIQPIDQVLFALKEQLDTKDTLIIQDITLGYAMLNSDEMHILEEEAIPVYKIIIEGLEEPIFVNAYNNKQEQVSIVSRTYDNMYDAHDGKENDTNID